ncbi:MAG: ABC transporter substrate-binding protein [Phreatobacter sp.]|uniref:ABC transporter substrate-binding protein n=1 Tax=Phreatobacter sp. TaxID=1966341 RepID=UPI001A58F088|nr:ABC transporter substrate-binding protein [Phreatobacter sp.]MBL8570467.1 ABC transporter substrate-binding protein [Phreatobacter sp.]
MRPGRLAAALAVALACIVPAMASEPPRRIVSLNLCADQFVLALADRDRIVALSRLATDPAISAAADAARGLPQTGGTAEEVLSLNPDLVLVGPLDRLGTARILAARGFRVERMALPATFAETQAEIRRIAALVGHPERGEALAARLDALPLQLGRMPAALPYERRGYAAGAASLTGEVLSRAGFRHADQGSAGLGRFVPLEAIVAARPDALVVSETAARAADHGSALLLHPVLARLFPSERRVTLPAALTVCPGPALADAVEHLAEARRRLP